MLLEALFADQLRYRCVLHMFGHTSNLIKGGVLLGAALP
jgi:hypothetical protein